MANCLDTLATALQVKSVTDDLLKAAPRLPSRQPLISITTTPSDAELVTFVVMQALLGFASGACRLTRARAHLRDTGPLPQGVAS